MHLKTLAVVALFFLSTALDSSAQQRRGMAGPPQPRFGSSIAKLFGPNKAFTADAQMEVKMESGQMTMPGKLAFLDGKTRFEMDASKIKGGAIPPQAAEQMKQMGMAEMVSISRPDKNENYVVYPALKSYAAIPEPEKNGDSKGNENDLKRTEIGKETVAGHECTKYKVLVQDEEGKEHESTVWTAKDLNDFPIKIESITEGVPSTVLFTNVKLEKPDESLFNPPADFQRYTDMGTMMREQMMKRLAPGAPQPR